MRAKMADYLTGTIPPPIVVDFDSGLGPSAGVFWHSEQSGGGNSCSTDVYATGTPVGQDLGCPAGLPPTYAVPGVIP